MNWKKWKMGLFVAVLSGLFTGGLGLGVGMTAKQILLLIVLNISKDGFLYIKSNPIDQVSFETSRITKDEAAGTTTSQSSKTVITGTPPQSALNHEP